LLISIQIANLAQLFDLNAPLAPGLSGYKLLILNMERAFLGELIKLYNSLVDSKDITEAQAISAIEVFTSSQQADMSAYAACTTVDDIKYVFRQHWINIYYSIYIAYYRVGALTNFKAVNAVLKGLCGSIVNGVPDNKTSYPSLDLTLKGIEDLSNAIIARDQVKANQFRDSFYNYFPKITPEIEAVYVANGGSTFASSPLFVKISTALNTTVISPVLGVPTFFALLASQPPKQVSI